MLNIPEKIENSIFNSERAITSQDLVEKFNIKKRTAAIYLSRLSRDGVITRIGRRMYLSLKDMLGREIRMLSHYQLLHANYVPNRVRLP